MVCLYFGLPGAGKTTILTSIALKESKRMLKGKSPYLHIYSNVPLKIDGVTFIDNDCIGKYDLSDCLLLIDEATLFADNRDYKNFKYDKVEYFLEHRHFKADVFLFTQQWDGVDKKIRSITDRVYYVYKGFWLGRWISTCYRVPYGIIIPDKKDTGSSNLGEIIQGYCKPSLISRIFFSTRLYRPKYYKYFDSFIKPYRDPLPDKYKVYFTEKGKAKFLKRINKKNKKFVILKKSKTVKKK